MEELPLFDLDAEGDHDYLFVEKVGMTTDQVVDALAEAFGIARREIGYAGRKDRWARTRQWFSLRRERGRKTLQVPDLGDGIEILESGRGSQKLRLGDLAGNRFVLRVSAVSPAQWEQVSVRLETIDRAGFANRFGRQRFGHDQDNAQAGMRILVGETRVRNRRRARFLLSALQSLLFNRVVELRERRVPLDSEGRRAIDQVLDGDLLVSHGTGLCLRAVDPREQQQLADRMEMSASGPMFGSKMMRPGGLPRALESEVLHGLDLQEAQWRSSRGAVEMSGERRPLRCPVTSLESDYLGAGDGDLATGDVSRGIAVLRFELPPGSYATVLLTETFAGLGLRDARGGTANEGARKRS